MEAYPTGFGRLYGIELLIVKSIKVGERDLFRLHALENRRYAWSGVAVESKEVVRGGYMLARTLSGAFGYESGCVSKR